MSSTLARSLAIFTELGWNRLTMEQALEADLGSAAQRKEALAGLRRGELHEEIQQDGSLHYRSLLEGYDRGMVSLFAIRLGVEPTRAIQLAWSRPSDKEAMARAVLSRGEKYALAFRARARWGLAHVALIASYLGQLPVPASREELELWVEAAVNGLTAEVSDANVLEERVVLDRFVEHVRAAIEWGLPPQGLTTLLSQGQRRGLLTRDQAYRFTLYALTAAVRPADQKGWALHLVQGLSATDAELLRDAEALIPVLAAGQPQVVAALSPALLTADVPDVQLGSVVLACSAVKTAKGRRELLGLLARRPAPLDPDTLAICLATIEPLVQDGDAAVAKAAAKVLDMWGQDASPRLESPGVRVRGLWRATPPLWEVARFNPGVAADLPDTVAEIRRGADDAYTITHEQCLAQIVQGAREDAASVRALLRPFRGAYGVLWAANYWARDASMLLEEKYHYPLVSARNFQVLAHLTQLPCVLSLPTWVDGRIDAADVIRGLADYASADVPAREADVALAFARLDPATMTDELWGRLRTVNVRVEREDGTAVEVDLPRLVGIATQEAAKSRHGKQGWPAALASFPQRELFYDSAHDLMTWPCRGDDVARAVQRGYPGDGVGPQGALARQLARSASPLGPGASMNLLAALDNRHASVVAGVAQGIEEAWERGLLRPAVADVTQLDWRQEPPTRVAGLVAALREAAELASASVVWPLLDSLVRVCTSGTKPLPGTAEAVVLLWELLPEARAAVANGLAPASVLDLPAVRALYGRGGSSKAVAAAARLCQELGLSPATESPATPTKGLWHPPPVTLTSVPDDAVVQLTERGATLASPSLDGQVAIHGSAWLYPLTYQGLLACTLNGQKGFLGSAGPGCLRWVTDEERRAETFRPGPMARSFVAVLLAGVTGDLGVTYAYAVRDVLRAQAGSQQQLGPQDLRAAWAMIAGQVNIGRLMRIVRGNDESLSSTWPMLRDITVWLTSQDSIPTGAPAVFDEVLVYLPEVLDAVASGLADAELVTFPGLAEFASRRGTSTALAKARALQQRLSVFASA